MKRALSILCLAFISLGLQAQNARPVVSITDVQLDQVNQQVTLEYSLADAENEACTVWFKASANGGEHFLADVSQLSGDIGAGITPGSGKSITWTYTGIGNLADVIVRVVADDGYAIDIQDLVDQVDSSLMRQRLQELSGIRHYVANPSGLNKTRDTIESLMQQYGLQSEKQSFTWNATTGYNYNGRIAGLSNEASTYIIDAHYDTVNNSPGADDNGSGVTGMLEIMRVLSQYDFRNSIRFLGFDLEEAGLIGSNRYVQSGIKPYEQIEGVFNFEMIGYYSDQPNSQSLPAGFDLLFPTQTGAIINDQYRGNFLTIVGNAASQPLIDALNTQGAQYVPALKRIALVFPGNGSLTPDLLRSDHASFYQGGMKALMLTDGAEFRNKNYHKPADTLGALNFTFMSNVAKATLAATAVLAQPLHAGRADYSLATLSAHDHAHAFPCTAEVYPNPVKNECTLKLGACAGSAIRISLFDTAGNLYFQQEWRGKGEESLIRIPTAKLAAGTYALLLESGEATQYLKVVK